MNKKILFFGLVAIIFAIGGCKSKVENEETANTTELAAATEEISIENASDSVVNVELPDSTELTNDTENEPYEKKIADTVIGGVKFKRYYFDIRTDDIADNTLLIVPTSGNADANKKIIKTLLDDFSLDADSLQQQLEEIFDTYASGEYAEYGDEYHESESIVYPINVTGKKYVSYLLHSSLFWPGEQNHPQWADVYYMFDLDSGEQIYQNDIFDNSQESRQAVGNKLHEELVKFAGNEEDIFVEAGSELLNGNFVFDDKGLTYFYQPYEVGPYMLGEPEVFIPKEWIKPYLKTDGVLYEYWFRK